MLMARPYCMRELGQVLGLAKSSLTGLVDRSAQRGLVRRAQTLEDGRMVRVELTPEGARLAEEFYAETCRRVEALASGLDDTGRATLADLLGRLVEENEVPEVFLPREKEASASPDR
ncbi:MarR family transcriptional regulator [Actinomadura miaoliensis]|uniref:MarR family winged helix-turn-helix transcriptional regulator n=1 Tax=Actinomadura miaoliensis TaxID=430685 RepID=UPI0031E9A619